MTQKQIEDIDKLLSAVVDNTFKIGTKIESHSIALGNIYTDLGKILKNQEIILNEIIKLKQAK